MIFEEGSDGWQLHPMEGGTGQAYMGVRDEEKVFLKKNTSPFLAALSIHGITPRLKWTKRTSQGDIFSAQEWCNGRSLEVDEMNSQAVAHIVQTVHSSDSLLRMLKKVGGQVYSPEQMLSKLVKAMDQHELAGMADLPIAIDRLSASLPPFELDQAVVNHGDMSRKNWLLTDHNKLYLVDWDEAIITDAAYDIASILYHYIPQDCWEKWLEDYGLDLGQGWQERLDWYGHLSLAQSVCRYQTMNDENKARACYLSLKKRMKQN